MHRPNGIGTLAFGTKGGLRQRTVPLGAGLGDPATTETLADACVRVQTHARMHTLYVCTYTHTHAQCAWTGHDHHQGIMCSLDISSTCGLLEVGCSVTNAKEQVHLDSLRTTSRVGPKQPNP